MSADESSPPKAAPPAGPPPAPARHPWTLPATAVAMTAIVVGGAVYCFKSCRDLPGEAIDKTGKLVEKVGRQLQSVAAAFKQGTITTTFASNATTLSGSQFLQFATLSQTETFTRKDESSVAFGYIPLPDLIVEARAPVTYTYYLDLNERWDFLLQNNVIYVTAPDIRFNQPAVDASRITYEVRKDSILRKTSEAMESLKKSITALSLKRAQANIDLVRETGRHQTELFVQNWLANNFSDGKAYPVKLRFRNETTPSSSGTSSSDPSVPKSK